MTMSIGGSAGLTFPDSTTQTTSAFYGGLGFRNRIINGAMMIDQRNAGASVTPSSIYTLYTIDRWFALYSNGSKFSVQQNAGSVTPPTGYVNYLGATSLAATSLGPTDFYQLDQAIEGLNIADLGWGTANAATVTLSFWVRSSLTGTFGGSLRNSANNRSYPFSYTISVANTWEQKSITIAGDTSGTWLTTNGQGILLGFNLGTGSTYSGTANAWAGANYLAPTGATSVVGTNGATFYITGVQLEKGSTATSFDYRPYGTELALCQRYYEKSYDQSVAVGAVNSNGVNSTVAYQVSLNRPFWSVKFGVTKRTSASVTLYTPNTLNTSGKIGGPSGSDVNAAVTNAGDSTFSLYHAGTPPTNTADYYAHWIASAEL